MDLQSLSNEELYLLLGEISEELLSRPKILGFSKEKSIYVRFDIRENVKDVLNYFKRYGAITDHRNVWEDDEVKVMKITFEDPRDAADVINNAGGDYEVSYEEF